MLATWSVCGFNKSLDLDGISSCSSSFVGFGVDVRGLGSMLSELLSISPSSMLMSKSFVNNSVKLSSLISITLMSPLVEFDAVLIELLMCGLSEII